jgi:hypothetical protein
MSTETQANCNLCNNTNSTKRCSACKKVTYCSEQCQKMDWKVHKLSCTYVSKIKVCHVNGIQVTEATLDSSELASAALNSDEWKTCAAPKLLGIPLIYKHLRSANASHNDMLVGVFNEKNNNNIEVAQVMLVEPDEYLLNGAVEVIDSKEKFSNNMNNQIAKMRVKSLNDAGYIDYQWSDKAWKINTEKLLGPLVFARADQKPLTPQLFWDLFNYIYDIMEYYQNGEVKKFYSKMI